VHAKKAGEPAAKTKIALPIWSRTSMTGVIGLESGALPMRRLWSIGCAIRGARIQEERISTPLHVVDAETGELERHKLRRDRVTTFFANRQRSLVALEACGGAHHWARTLQALGHEVKLLPAKHVRPFV
jgi:hypothetical protein